MKAGVAVGVAIIAAMLAGSARAEIVFRDTFSGTRLRPHWQQPPIEHWEHTVGGGQLTVTDLFHPGVPGQLNTATIATEFSEFMSVNFELTALLGWEPGEGRVFSVRLWGPSQLVAAFGYDDSGPSPLIFLATRNPFEPFRTVSAPSPGTHEFRLVDNHADGQSLYVDGERMLGFGGATGQGVTRMEVEFAGTEGVAFRPLNVGLVSIVPVPGTILALAGGIGIANTRRR